MYFHRLFTGALLSSGLVYAQHLPLPALVWRAHKQTCYSTMCCVTSWDTHFAFV
jgi:hypothetical protein